MQHSIYRALTRAPALLFSGSITFAGLLAALYPNEIREILGIAMIRQGIQNVGFAGLTLAVIYFALLWVLKPTAAEGDGGKVIAHGNQPVAVGVMHGDFHQHQAAEKYSKVIEFKMMPAHLGGIQVVDLDGIATLRLTGPYSEQTATLSVDLVPTTYPDNIQPNFQVTDFHVHVGNSQTLFFDTSENKRRTVEAGGKVFIIALREIEVLNVPGVAKPLRFEFSVREP
jgi:hypothetical protein